MKKLYGESLVFVYFTGSKDMDKSINNEARGTFNLQQRQ